MLFNKEINLIYCFECGRWYDPFIEVYLYVTTETSITCRYNHFLGNEYDPEWLEFFRQDE